VQYVSTRGSAPVLGFEDVLLTGLARDGGLYLPAAWPALSPADLGALRGRPYAHVAAAVMAPFVAGSIPQATFHAMAEEAYAGFAHPATAPLKQLAPNHFLLELFHGPTLAFKDFAMQLLARLMDWALEKRGERATVVGATSGDTGGAAIEAFRSSRRANLFVLHPKGRVSPVQRKQMTSVISPSIHNIAIEGTFDDCQAIVKAMFNNQPFRDRHRLAGVNSINWARIMAQTVYYVTAAVALGAPHRAVSFAVPTGNFGDVFAGYAAAKMGVPVKRLVVATNENDILDRALSGGRYETRGVVASTSPSMDIQVSSNFERAVFEALGRDAATTAGLMQSLSQSGGFTIPDGALAALRTRFASARVGEAEVAETIRRTWTDTGELLDPHTAVGYAAARRHAGDDAPMVTLATAHPAKFPDAVEAASGVRPPLPAFLGDLMAREERYDTLPADAGAVERYIAARSAA
jgi:threonine synthase